MDDQFDDMLAMVDELAQAAGQAEYWREEHAKLLVRFRALEERLRAVRGRKRRLR